MTPAMSMMPMNMMPMNMNPMMMGGMPMMGMMPAMACQMTCTMTQTGMTCEMKPAQGMNMDMFMECCKRMTAMMDAGMPMMMACGGMPMMMCMKAA